MDSATDLSILEITVDLLWSVEQVEHLQKKLIHTQDFEIYLSLLHLPKCKLKVHLSEVENPTQVLRQTKIKWAFDQGDQSCSAKYLLLILQKFTL